MTWDTHIRHTHTLTLTQFLSLPGYESASVRQIVSSPKFNPKAARTGWSHFSAPLLHRTSPPYPRERAEGKFVCIHAKDIHNSASFRSNSVNSILLSRPYPEPTSQKEPWTHEKATLLIANRNTQVKESKRSDIEEEYEKKNKIMLHYPHCAFPPFAPLNPFHSHQQQMSITHLNK